MSSIRDNKCIYHLTALSNLESILTNGLMSRESLIESHRRPLCDVANSEIIEKRNLMGLNDCVPFHFHTYTDFDVFVQHNNKSENFIYLAIYRNLAEHKGFLIIPKHPLACGNEDIYSYADGFNEIDWDIMNISSGFGYDKQVRMAECLSPHRDIKFDEINIIFVPNNQIEKEVNGILQRFNVKSRIIQNSALFSR